MEGINRLAIRKTSPVKQKFEIKGYKINGSNHVQHNYYKAVNLVDIINKNIHVHKTLCDK